MPRILSEITLDTSPFVKIKGEKSNKNSPPMVQKINNKPVRDYIGNFIDVEDDGVVFLNSGNRTDFDAFLNINYNSIINYYRINDVRYINKYFEKVNSLLPQNGIYIGTFENSKQRKQRILDKYPLTIAYPFYFLTFVLKRIFPKWRYTKKIYFFLTQGKNRYLSIAEVLGRLVSCGFEIVNFNEQNSKTFFVVKKVKEPSFDHEPSYGPLFKMKRVGKDGKRIKVYKFRTMHPYAEYIQDFIHKKNNLNKGGKFNNDFRITGWGKIFRKYWIDELPMLINVMKGELKIVGVRPLSDHYLGLYTDDLKNLRLRTKPGLFPPFYADMPKTLDEIMNSEKNYLTQYFESPFKTDFIYLIKIIKNIIFYKARSS